MHNHYIKTYKSSLIHFGHHCFARPQSWKSWSSGSRGLWDQSMNAMMTGMTKGTHMLSFDHDAHTHVYIYIFSNLSLSIYIFILYYYEQFRACSSPFCNHLFCTSTLCHSSLPIKINQDYIIN